MFKKALLPTLLITLFSLPLLLTTYTTTAYHPQLPHTFLPKQSNLLLPPQFDTFFTFGDPENTSKLATADFNGDGLIDIVTGNNESATAPNILYTNKGNNTFTPTNLPGSPQRTITIAAADLNGDGSPDIVAGNYGENAVYLNDGYGNFTTPPTLFGHPLDESWGLAIADMNNDGALDIIIGNEFWENYIYFNNGDGTDFSTSVNTFDTGYDYTYDVAIGDFNGDTYLDILTANYGDSDKLFLNNGSGGFNPTVYNSATDLSIHLAIADLDNNGTLDFVTVASGGPNYIYLNDGNASFTATPFGTGSDSTRTVDLADIDGDGDFDIIAATFQNYNQIYFNDGFANFNTNINFGSNNAQTKATYAADINGDHLLDIIEVGFNRQNTVYLNRGDSLFSAPPLELDNTIESVQPIVAGDLNGDNYIDIAVGVTGQSNKIYLNDSNGNFTGGTLTFGPGNDTTKALAIADLNGDTHLDLVTGNDGQLNRVFLNNGNATFSSASLLNSNFATSNIAIGDLNHDGALDIILNNPDDINQIYFNNGDGTFGSPYNLTAAAIDSTNITLGDLNEDGLLDMAIGFDNEQIQIYLNDSTGLFITPTLTLSSGLERVQGLTFGDIDNNGTTDIIVANYFRPNIIYFGNGDGTFISPPTIFDPNSEPSSDLQTVDINRDGALDIIVSNLTAQNRLFLNDGHGNFSHQILWGTGSDETVTMAIADYDHNGSLDIATANTDQPRYIHWHSQHRLPTQPDHPTQITIQHPTTTKPSPHTSSPQYLTTPIITFTYALADNNSNPLGHIKAYYSVDGGGRWLPAIATNTTITANLATSPAGTSHTYAWDTLASGFFGQSDNTLFRLEAYPIHPTHLPTNTYSYPNHIQDQQQYPFVAATSYPFRLRGTQIRVYSNTVQSANVAPGALIYRLPANQAGSRANPLTNSAGQPFTTDSQGYLTGRGSLGLNDTIYALLPITHTDSYTLYYTSGTPTPTGLDGFNITTPGTQNLVVDATKPLYLFNLRVSLEWDATNDGLFLNNLSDAIRNASDILYDITNGQAAIGDIRFYQQKENWHNADLLIYAANDIHPSASLGGVVTEATHEIGLTGVITNAYRPGLIRMGTNWDPVAENQADLTQDWWRALAHELGHYLLFMPDNYVGFDENGLLATDCLGSFMTNTRDDLYSELLPPADWVGPCLDTVAEKTTGRSDWETTTIYYPLMQAPPVSSTNLGPTFFPLNTTNITIFDPPYNANPTFPAGNYMLRNATTGQITTRPKGQAYLLQSQDTPDPLDDTIVDLGITNAGGDRIKLRGAQPNDELCLLDTSETTTYLGCTPVNASNGSLNIYAVNDWRPNINVQSVNSVTLAITVTQYVTSGNLNIHVIPGYGLPGQANVVTGTIASLTPVDPGNPVTFTGQITTDYLFFEGIVRIWVPGTTPPRQAISYFTISLDAWGGESAVWGGESAVWSGESAIWSGESAIWGGESAIWGGPTRPWGAPAVSRDGQLIILNLDDPYGPTGISTMQAVDTLPNLPPWLNLVGQAYRVQSRPGYTSLTTRTLSFDYLQRQTPPGYESTLTIYYSADNGDNWQRLPTQLDMDDNRAVTLMDVNNPDGLYALIATVNLNPFTTGWNLFGYPILETRPITTALASIDGQYTSVYHYDANSSQWLIYDTPVINAHPNYAALVNTLDTLDFGLGYWLYATEPITLFLAVPNNGNALIADNKPAHNNNHLFSFPPATYYGPVTGATAGMAVTATIDGNLCGTGTVINWNGSLTYKLQVSSANGDGCGLTNRSIIFNIDGQPVAEAAPLWQNNQAQYHPLTLSSCLPATTPTAVTATPNNLDILLTWTDTSADNYEIWTHTSPYTLPGSDCGLAANCTLSATNNYTAVNNAGDPATNYYYHIIATNSCGDRAPATPTIGEFDYNLITGQ
ncbi:MAG TPA: VCBS repeat-containing protein [Anaerolineae bacterium]|nr:VCBS repeat-containing protein [Anaerolineae bacterium]